MEAEDLECLHGSFVCAYFLLPVFCLSIEWKHGPTAASLFCQGPEAVGLLLMTRSKAKVMDHKKIDSIEWTPARYQPTQYKLQQVI